MRSDHYGPMRFGVEPLEAAMDGDALPRLVTPIRMLPELVTWLRLGRRGRTKSRVSVRVSVKASRRRTMLWLQS